MNRRAPLAALFFLSGVSGLIYQVAWFRRLALIFGVTSYALGIVLAAFMGGLALGSLLGGRLADKGVNPLRTYALVEILIACFSLLVLPSVGIVQQLYVALAPGLHDHMALLSGLRFALSFATLIPATMCMGATLPLGVRALNASDSRGLSLLYAANTAGAVFGVMGAAFALLGIFGLSRSAMMAAALNVMCGLGAFALSRRDAPAAGVAGATRPSLSLTGEQKVVFAALTLSGFVALAYEVIWTRLFAVLAFEIVYGYAVMLSVLLAGIAVGSAVYDRWSPSRDAAVRHLLWLELGIGVIAALAALLLAPFANGSWLAGAIDWPGIGGLVRRCAGCVSMLPALLAIVFITSALSGATMPAAARVLAGAGPGWATRLGLAYGGNVIGGVFGSVVVGFWLLPSYGAHVSLLVMALLNLVIAVGLAVSIGRPSLAAICAGLGLVALAPATLGAERFDLYRATLSARLSTARILWYDEGREASVAVAETTNDRFLLINGAIHSASSGLYYHRWLGHLGPIAHPAARDALIIGLGGGATAGAMALHPGLNIHIVELSDGVLAAANGVLSDDNYGLFQRPGVTREADDGRNHLLVSHRQYDIIEADIVEPRHAGASVLYSREYFESAARSLKPGGVMVQWLGASGSDAYKWTLNSFRAAFPHVTLWVGGDVGIGSNQPQSPLERARLEQLFTNPELRRALIEASLETPDKILALRKGEPERFDGGPMLTDDRPVLEYFLTLPFMTRRAFGN